MMDEKSHEFEGYYFNGGLVINLTESFSLGAMFRTPYTKKSQSQSLYRFAAPEENTDIKLETSGESRFKQPLILGAGFSYRFSQNFRLAADLNYFNWSNYKVEFFGEEQGRDFKNVLQLSVGAEFQRFTNILGMNLRTPMWIGFSYDPQPMRNPNSFYLFLSVGIGIHGEHLFLDFGSKIGWESGSGNNLRSQNMGFTMGFTH